MVTAATTTSGTGTAGADLATVLHRLRDNREAIVWSERRGLVARIAPPLSEGEALEPFRSLMILLAEDPKWEVRLEVARAVGNTVDGDLAQLAHRLADDSHSYVQRAARRSIQQRRRAAREAQKKKRGIDLVLALYQELEEKHGKQAAARARRLAEQLYDVLVGATVHEMQSVLTALKADGISLAERERQGVLEPTVLRRKLGKITERTGFLERLLRDMRNYARCAGDRYDGTQQAGLGDRSSAHRGRRDRLHHQAVPGQRQDARLGDPQGTVWPAPIGRGKRRCESPRPVAGAVYGWRTGLLR